MAFSVFNKDTMDRSVFSLHYNTDTVFDLMTGSYVPGADGKYYLNGGLGSITGISGVSKRYKSSIALSLVLRILKRYPDAEIVIADSEFAINSMQRIIDLSNDPAIDTNRVAFINKENMTLDGVFAQIKEIAKTRKAHSKEIEVEVPILDVRTGKPMRSQIPTFFIIDSLSKLELSETDKAFDKYELGDSKLKMTNMDNGNAKTMFMNQLTKVAASAGIHFILTAHIDSKFEMNGPYAPAKAKDLTYMKSNEEFKGVGSKFKFYCTTCMEARKSTPLLNSDRTECLYPLDLAQDSLHEVNGLIIRGNNNQSGLTANFIVSQQAGIQSALSYFHMLKDKTTGGSMFGLTGNNTNQQNGLLPDITFNRRNIRSKLNESYELSRAMEILGQLCYIQTYWSWYSYRDKVDFSIKPEDFVNQVLKGTSVKVSDILNSRGYWTYDKKEKRPYYSIFDILLLLKKNK